MTRSVSSARTATGARTPVAIPRRQISGNTVFNSSFEFAPVTNVAQTVTNWIDGTASGSASRTPYGWYGINQAGSGTIQFDNTTSHSGSLSLRLSNTTTASGTRLSMTNSGNYAGLTSANIGDLIPFFPGLNYTFGFWAKTNNLPAGGAAMQIKELSRTLSVLQTRSVSTPSGTNNWANYSSTATSDPACAYLGILIFNSTTGNVCDLWIDDLYLALTTALGRTAA